MVFKMADATAPAKRKGNYRPGPGRPPGRKNDKTLALEAASRKAAASISEGFEGDAHAFLQAVYRNPDVPIEIRIIAAGRALRVEKPTLAASHSTSEININLASRLESARQRVANRPTAEGVRPRILLAEPEPGAARRGPVNSEVLG